MTNEMRKLMETVAPLFDDKYDGVVGFRQIKVAPMADDITVDGKVITAQVIWIYDSSDLSAQRGFTDSDVSDEEYDVILGKAILEVNYAIREAQTEKDWDGKNYRFDYIALGADVHKDINKELVNDIISKTSLSGLPSTVSDNGDYVVFEIERPKKKRFWQR